MKALVTGGCKGLGKSFTIELLKRGYQVYALYNTSVDSALALENEYDNVRCIKCDIRKEHEVESILFNIDDIDLIINNAAIAMDNEYQEKTGKEFLSVLETNVVGTFLVTKYGIPKMSCNGVIINISSNNTFGNNSPLSMDYDASKAGVNMLTINFSEVLKDIKVLAYAPGWIDTEEVRKANPEFVKNEMQKSNQSKLINPDELVKYIIEDIQMRNTGEIIEIKEV